MKLSKRRKRKAITKYEQGRDLKGYEAHFVSWFFRLEPLSKEQIRKILTDA
jgi:hypothetical protein